MKISNWLSLKPGNKLKLDGEKVRIEHVYKFKEQDNLCQIVLLKATDSGGSFYICAKIVDQNIDVVIYNEIGWVGTGDRKRLVADGSCPLFKEPRTEHFRPCDLEWAESIEFSVGKDNTAVAFNKNRIVYGEVEELPKPSGLDKSYCELAEYTAIQQVDNPEVMFVEFGGIDYKGDPVQSGGFVLPLEGYMYDNKKVDSCWF